MTAVAAAVVLAVRGGVATAPSRLGDRRRRLAILGLQTRECLKLAVVEEDSTTVVALFDVDAVAIECPHIAAALRAHKHFPPPFHRGHATTDVLRQHYAMRISQRGEPRSQSDLPPIRSQVSMRAISSSSSGRFSSTACETHRAAVWIAKALAGISSAAQGSPSAGTAFPPASR